MKKILIPLLVLAGWLAVPQAKACWKFVPIESRMAGATYVVVGKITGIVDVVKRHGRMYEVGAIKVSKVLKGPKALEEVMLVWPSKDNQIRISTDISFGKGQEGVWILYPDSKEKGVYRASYPSDYQSLKAVSLVEEKLKVRRKCAT